MSSRMGESAFYKCFFFWILVASLNPRRVLLQDKKCPPGSTFNPVLASCRPLRVTTTLRKCCPFGEIFTLAKKPCKSSNIGYNSTTMMDRLPHQKDVVLDWEENDLEIGHCAHGQYLRWHPYRHFSRISFNVWVGKHWKEIRMHKDLHRPYTHLDDVCFDNIQEQPELLFTKICIKKVHVKVRKCCPFHEVYHNDSESCGPSHSGSNTTAWMHRLPHNRGIVLHLEEEDVHPDHCTYPMEYYELLFDPTDENPLEVSVNEFLQRAYITILPHRTFVDFSAMCFDSVHEDDSLLLARMCFRQRDNIEGRKCCPFHQVYDIESGSCTLIGSSLDVWNQVFSGIGMEVYDIRPDLCNTGLEYYEVILDFGKERKPVVKSEQGWRLLDHPHEPFVDLDQICLDGVYNKFPSIVFRMCFRPPCEDRVCVRKCCPQEQAYFGSENFVCGETANPLKIIRHRVSGSEAKEINEEAEKMKLHVVNKKAGNCTQLITLDPKEDNNYEFYVDENGLLHMPNFGDFTRDQYCVERVNDRRQAVAFVCAQGYQRTKRSGYTVIVMPVIMVSEVLLVSTFWIYCAIPDLRNLKGKKVMSYVASLFWAYLGLALIQLRGLVIAEASKGFCIALGVLVHYFFMVSFFWLNSMSFDIWRTFRTMKMQSRQKERRVEWRRFLLSSLYSWGMPVPISCSIIIIEMTSDISLSHLKPRFTLNGCWFASKEQIWPYMGPMGFVLLSNVLFFVLTTVKLVQLRKETKVLQSLQADKMQQKHKNRFWLYVKLLLVMGVTWISQLVTWMLEVNIYVDYILSILNALQGFFVFMIFVGKKKVFMKLNNKEDLLRSEYLPSYFSRSSTVSDQDDSSETDHPNEICETRL